MKDIQLRDRVRIIRSIMAPWCWPRVYMPANQFRTQQMDISEGTTGIICGMNCLPDISGSEAYTIILDAPLNYKGAVVNVVTIEGQYVALYEAELVRGGYIPNNARSVDRQ